MTGREIAPADRLVTLPDGTPELTLGFHAIWWAATYLRHPNGPRAGLSWEYTESQARFILWWYSIQASSSRWIYQHAVRRWSKGTGKSPGAAALSLTELLGPVRFAGFAKKEGPFLEGTGKNGLPKGWIQIGWVIGKPVSMPLVQIAGVSEAATANTMRHVRAMTAKNSKVVQDYHLDPGKTVIYTPSGGQLEVITSSAASAEGAEVTAAFLDEPEHWTPATGGVDLAATIDRNLAKSGSRAIETANAWEPGAGSVAEATFDAWCAQEEGRTKSGSLILYDARVAPPDTNLADEESLRRGIAHAYGDSYWVDQQVILDRILSLRTKPSEARRFYLNQPVASEDAWITQQEWAALADPTQVICDGDEIVAFFDGSKSRDATALLGCHVETGYVFTIGIWEPPTGTSHSPGSSYEVPVSEVNAAVEAMFDQWDVRAFFADVREWESFVKVTWPERYADQLELHAVPTGKEPQAIAWDMRTHTYDFTMAAELTLTEITELQDGEPVFRHDGDSRTGRHMVYARRHPNRWGVSIAKESRDSPKKIDAAVCVIGARMARRLLLAHRAAHPVKKPRSGRVHGFA
jgi:hypothetical protein